VGTTGRWLAKAKESALHAASTLKNEYQAGKRGDDAPAAKIWPTAGQQAQALVAALGALAGGSSAGPAADVSPPTETDLDADAAEVVGAMARVDWSAVRAATAERTSDAAQAMRAAAEHVDWAKVQPMATQLSSALIAAVASGQLGVGGKLGSTVARTIVDQGGLARKVTVQLQGTPGQMPPDFRQVIDTTAHD
jgi:hypothetical protein